jgi:hypothetical protein
MRQRPSNILQIAYRDADGITRQCPAEAACDLPFETYLPARTIPSYPGQRHTPGSYWAATTEDLIDFESFLENQHLLLLDFDPEITAFVGQPFIFEGVDTDGAWRHVPDIFARTLAGGAVLIDVSHPSRDERPAVIRQSRRTEMACRDMGWDYRRAGAVDPQLWANLSWLSAYRRPLYADRDLIDPLIAGARSPIAIGDLLATTPVPELARPVLLHLCWHHRIDIDLDHPFRETTLVCANPHRSTTGDTP